MVLCPGEHGAHPRGGREGTLGSQEKDQQWGDVGAAAKGEWRDPQPGGPGPSPCARNRGREKRYAAETGPEEDRPPWGPYTHMVLSGPTGQGEGPTVDATAALAVGSRVRG